MKKQSQNAQFSFHLNENLMGVMISYLMCRDIVALSQVNKLYRKVTKSFDPLFKEVSYSFFFSQYDTYNLDNQLNCSNLISSCDIIEEEKIPIEEASVPSLYTWKGLFGIGVYIKDSWVSSPLQLAYQSDLALLNAFLYSNLKECEILPRLRKQNHIVEAEFNSPFQTFLYDFIYEQQDLYDEYDCKMANYKKEPILCRKADLPFCDLICKFCNLIQSIDTSEKKETLKMIRWYMCFEDKLNNNPQSLSHNQSFCWTDNNDLNGLDGIKGLNEDDSVLSSDGLIEEEQGEDKGNCPKEGEPIELTKALVNKFLQNEANPLFFVINCICLTMTFYCQYAMNYLFLSFNKDGDLLSEYIKIYKNYIDTAIGFNDYCENINVALNYCYEEIWKEHASFPKFSVFRLLILTWNRELTNRLNQNDTMLMSLKDNLLSIVSKTLNEFSEKTQGRTSCEGRKSNVVDDFSIEESVSTKHSSILQSESLSPLNPLSLDDYLQEEESINNFVMEQGLSTLSDTFSDEYSVFSLNLSNLEVNSFYKDIEDKVIDKVEAMIKGVYEAKVHEQSLQAKGVIEDILQYFSTSTFTSKIMPQLKIRIYHTVYSVLLTLLRADMKMDFTKFISTNKLSAMKEFKANTFFELHPNTLQSDKVYQTLLTFISPLSIPTPVKEYCAVRYIKETSKLSTSCTSVFSQVNDWIIEHQEKAVYKNKQVVNELKRKNIKEHQGFEKQMLSYFWRPNWAIIEKATTIALEKKHALTLPNHHLNTLSTSINRNDLALILKLV